MRGVNAVIKNKIQSKVAKAFDKKLADAVDTFTCTVTEESGDFDFATQTYPIVTTKEYSGRGVLFGSYLKDMVKPNDYHVADCKAICLQNEVTAVPEINEIWVTEKGNFRVVNVGADPVGATYIVQLRKVGA